MTTYKVLIFPYGTEISYEIINSLLHHKIFNLVLASSDESICTIGLKEQIYYLPYVFSDKFESELASFIEKTDIDFIIPAHDEVAIRLSEIEQNINAKVVGQSKSTNQIVRYKDKTYKYFSEIIPTPIVFHQNNSLTYPVFTKPIKGQGSRNSTKLSSKKELDYFFSKNHRDDFIITEYLCGEEYTIDCFSVNGDIKYSGPRIRKQTINGISSLSSSLKEKNTIEELAKYANLISLKLNMNGVWFFQMKKNNADNLKLLEIGPRVSGTMMHNRIKGVNFIELALYSELGNDINIVHNEIEISIKRTLEPRYIGSITYKNLYIDFDDTLLLNGKHINTELISLIFQAKNKNIPVHLITKNSNNDLSSTLNKFGICNIFSSIIHLRNNEHKYDHIKENSLLIDDSFSERSDTIKNGTLSFGIDAVRMLLDCSS